MGDTNARPETVAAQPDRLAHLRAKRVVVLQYAHLYLDEQEFHGVCDAVNDLREIDAEIKGLQGR